MKKRPLDRKSPRKKRGLTQEGWVFLLDLLDSAGYRAKGPDGNLVVRDRLKDDLHHILHPEAAKRGPLSVTEKKDPKSPYNKCAARLQRLRPGHPQESAGDLTLRAICELPGLRDQSLYDDPKAARLFRKIVDPESYQIDFLRFCRLLFTSSTDDQKVEYKLPNENNSQLKDEPQTKGMYLGGVSFSISKLFGNLQLVPETSGLRFVYTPIVNNVEDVNAPGYLDLVTPLEAVGGFWATSRAFLYGVESLDENVILQGAKGIGSDILIKIYRDKPNGKDGRLDGTEMVWLRLVTGPREEERRRIKLGPRDLLCFELACQMTAQLAAAAGTHQPKPIPNVPRQINPVVMKELAESGWQTTAADEKKP